MSEPVTFKQYLESKEQLRRAVANTPQQELEYIVKKYCKLSLGESRECRVHVSLKPNQRVLVEWLYADFDNPTPVSIKVESPTGDVDEYDTYWSSSKLTKWLISNTLQPRI